jgi:hypothetical protein
MSKKITPTPLYISIPWMREHARPVADLQLDPANERTHDRANIESIKGSIRRFGIMEPIDVRFGVVLRGNGTTMALRELAQEKAEALEPLKSAIGGGPISWDLVPVSNLDHLDDAAAAAWRVTHNRTAELGRWDWAKLQETLLHVDVEWEGLGWESAELELLTQAKWEPPVIQPEPEAQATTDVSSASGAGERVLMLKLEGSLAGQMRELADAQNMTPAELLAAWVEQESAVVA